MKRAVLLAALLAVLTAFSACGPAGGEPLESSDPAGESLPSIVSEDVLGETLPTASETLPPATLSEPTPVSTETSASEAPESTSAPEETTEPTTVSTTAPTSSSTAPSESSAEKPSTEAPEPDSEDDETEVVEWEEIEDLEAWLASLGIDTDGMNAQ